MGKSNSFTEKMKRGKLLEKMKRAFFTIALAASCSGVVAAIMLLVTTFMFQSVIKDYGFS